MDIRHAVLAAALGSALVGGRSLAQSVETKPAPDAPARWSLIVPSGTIVPTGAQRHAIGRGNVTAVQLAYAPRPTFAITSTFGWARSRDVATTYDLGAEARAPRWLEGNGMSLMPFAGAGAGGRSYNYRKLDVDATHNLAAYVSAGGELRIRRVGLRLEARDYVGEFRALDGGAAKRIGNDVVFMAGLRLFSR
jgi:hypothetical protein